jgi:hypothetical protein
MGNQMFQFAFGHLVSRKLNTILLVDTYHQEFDLKIFQLVWPYSLLESTTIAKLYTKLQSIIKFKSRFCNLDCRIKIRHQSFTDKTEYIGYFQDGEIYRPHILQLRQLFKIKKRYYKSFLTKYGSILSKKKVLVISIRLGDYHNYKLTEYNNVSAVVPIDWYLDQLSKINTMEYQIFVVSDDISDAETKLKGKSQLDFIYVNDTVSNQFQLIQHADMLIISNSSFAWWGAFLSMKRNRKVIAPKNYVGFHANEEFPAGIQIPEFEWV